MAARLLRLTLHHRTRSSADAQRATDHMHKLLLDVILASAAVVGCGGGNKSAKNPDSDSAADKLEDSAKDAKKAAEKATERTGEAAEKAGDKAKSATKDEQ